MDAPTRRRLAKAIAAVAEAHEEKLAALRANAVDARRRDFIWHYLLQSYSTWGSARGYEGLMKNPANYAAVAYDLLRGKPPSRRIPAIERVMRRAKVRAPHVKAELLSKAVDVIAALGGPEAATTALWEQKGAAAKLRFLKQLPGVGAKYARNIMMDVYDQDFRASIAVDARILGFARDAGLQTAGLGALEVELLKIADMAGLDGWTVDRVLYWWADEVRAELNLPSSGGATAKVEALVDAIIAAAPGLKAERQAVESAVRRFKGCRIT